MAITKCSDDGNLDENGNRDGDGDGGNGMRIGMVMGRYLHMTKFGPAGHQRTYAGTSVLVTAHEIEPRCKTNTFTTVMG